MSGFPDVERAVGDVLAGLGACGVETPATLQSDVPYLRITRTGGSDDRVTDKSNVSVDVFAADATTAKATAEQARQLLTVERGIGTAHGLIDIAVTTEGPFLVPPTDTDTLRLAATSYQVSMRRTA